MLFGTVDCIPKTSLFLLSHITDIGQVSDCTNLLQPVVLACTLQGLFKFKGFVKVIFNGPFVSTGYNQYVINSGSDSFLNNILDCRFVINWQHFLWLRFCSRQKSCSKACCWNYSLHNLSPYKVYINNDFILNIINKLLI